MQIPKIFCSNSIFNKNEYMKCMSIAFTLQIIHKFWIYSGILKGYILDSTTATRINIA